MWAPIQLAPTPDCRPRALKMTCSQGDMYTATWPLQCFSTRRPERKPSKPSESPRDGAQTSSQRSKETLGRKRRRRIFNDVHAKTCTRSTGAFPAAPTPRSSCDGFTRRSLNTFPLPPWILLHAKCYLIFCSKLYAYDVRNARQRKANRNDARDGERISHLLSFTKVETIKRLQQWSMIASPRKAPTVDTVVDGTSRLYQV